MRTEAVRAIAPTARGSTALRRVFMRAAFAFMRAIPRERISRLVGRSAELRAPRFVLELVLGVYVRAFKVDLSEAVVPEGGFRTFNEFFTRGLRAGRRPIDADPSALVSPADGRLDDEGPLDDGSTFLVKGQSYDAAELLGDAVEAGWFQGGRYAIVYLSPRDYHRVHSPADAVVRSVRHIPGTLYPVNAIGVEHVPRLFARNERVVVHLDTEKFGRVAVVFVGAFVVGGISLTVNAPPRPAPDGAPLEHRFDEANAPHIERGAELGAFLLGSTVVLLTQRGPWREEPAAVSGTVKVGQVIARLGR